MPPRDPDVPPIRAAGPDDAEAIAALHVRSWRASYRGSLEDAYLDGPIEAERRAFWAGRLRDPPASLVTLVAGNPGAAFAGFLCALPDHDPRWGTLIDNLHVDPSRKGRGLGRALMAAAGAVLARTGSGRPVHLFVIAANHAALGFYRRLGGGIVDSIVHREPDGSDVPVHRVAWADVTAFRRGVEGSRP